MRHASSLLSRCIDHLPLRFVLEVKEGKLLAATVHDHEALGVLLDLPGRGKRWGYAIANIEHNRNIGSKPLTGGNLICTVF